MEIWASLWWISRVGLSIAARLRLSVEVRRSGPIPKGATIVCGKHSSAFDIYLIGRIAQDDLGSIPRFQMGSFVGYRLLGALVPVLNRLGGFCVMRPKEARRLRTLGYSAEESLARMREVNDAAEELRRRTLRASESLAYFPEGTRDWSELNPLKSTQELQSAVAVAAEGTPVSLWPIMVRYGAPRWFSRRPVRVLVLPPIDVGQRNADDLLAELESTFKKAWVAATTDVSAESATQVFAQPTPHGES